MGLCCQIVSTCAKGRIILYILRRILYILMISSENIVYSNNELKSVLGLPNALATSLFRENATTNQDVCWLCKKNPECNYLLLATSLKFDFVPRI